jgi:hypothetical protein
MAGGQSLGISLRRGATRSARLHRNRRRSRTACCVFRSAGVPPALLTFGSLRRTAFSRFVGRGFSRDIKKRP